MGSCELILLQQFVLILSFTIHQSWSHQCQNIDAIRGYRLVNHVLQTVHDVSFERCAVLCTEHPDCYSINHFTTTSTCELNNKTKLWFLSDFIPSDSVFYMDMLVRQYDPCVTEQPCKNDQDAKCLQYPSNTTVQCKCSRHYIGKNCEKFAPLQKGGNVTCSGQTLDLCQTNMTAWQATILGPTSLSLSGCNPDEVTNTAELLLFVSRARTDSQGDYGKYQIVRVKENTGCTVTLLTPINMTLSGTPCELIAQRLPYFGHISLTQSCQVTCRARSGAVGGILALRATKLTIDSTSKIQVNGKGFHGGAGGSSSGGGGFGGETFVCLTSTYGKGGDRGQPGDHGGGAGDDPSQLGEKGLGASRGPGGLNAGGGGGDSSSNPDDGGGGGGGGGHFSGGGGGGGATGSGLTGGYGGVASDVISTAAGGGGISFGGNGNGHNGGQTGETDGTSTRGGKGGYSEHHGYGGGGGGGGFQYGNVEFNTRISYGGGGGGGGGSQHGFVGGKGGNGGGLVLLFLDQLTLNGAIEAKGDPGSCPSNNVAFRAAPGGGGAGGSVVIFTQELLSNVNGKIFVQGGVRKKCANGAGGGAGGGIGRWVVKTPSSLTKSDV